MAAFSFMYFDRKIFFSGVRSSFGKLTQKQVNGLNRLVEAIENDSHVKDVRWAAYMLATSYHETAHTFHPIHEYGTRQYFIKRYGGQTRKGKELGNDTPEEGHHYAGKGDVQLTGEFNYERAEKALRKEYPELIAKWEAATGKIFDLTVGDQPNDEDDPKNVMHPEISYAVMSYGMRSGMFTSKKLSDYIKGSTCDYKGARKIVNGTDKNILIAGYATNFEKALRASLTSAAPLVSSEQPETTNDNPTVDATNTAETKQAIETTVTRKEGDVTVEASKTNQQDVNVPAVVNQPEPYLGVGFWGVIKKDLAAATGGNLSFSALAEYAQQASGWPDWIVGIISKLAIGALIATFGYFTFRVIHYCIDTWKKNQKVKVEVSAATDVNRKDIEWL